MLVVILLVIFGVGLIASYLVGVKRGQPWGAPAVALCAIGVIATVLVHLFSGGRGGTPPMGEMFGMANAHNAAEVLAVELAPALPEHSRIFIFGPMADEMGSGIVYFSMAAQSGLRKGLGAKTWDTAGYYGPVSGMEAGTFSQVLADAQDVDAIVSFNGVPADFESAEIFTRASPPLVAAYYDTEPPAKERLRILLQDGLLKVALVNEGGSLRKYTASRLP